MAVLKVIELLANSNKSWEDAAQNAIAHASKTIRKIRSVNVQNMSLSVGDDGKVKDYRLNLKVTFEVDG
ncbi:MAG: dodecin domain-containing protein [Chitinophagaceae bacterium]|jgi:flavin-binding protein dodecin|nr:MAG: dodecin domain-containing protein [Chitinophagaceae bacterium]